MKKLLAILLLAFVGLPIWAQQTVSVPFSSPQWSIEGTDHEIVQYKGQEALRLRGAQAWLDDPQFKTGTLEFDIAFSDTRGFQGVRWQVQDHSNFEEFYLRSHLSEMPDANQYNPVIAGNSGWQLYHGEGYSAPSLYSDDWMHVRIVLDGEGGDVYIDSESPQFRFTQKGHMGAGGFGVYASGFNTSYFANFSYRAADESLSGELVEFEDNSAGTVVSWMVSDPFGNDDMPDGDGLRSEALSSRNWQKLWAEEKGITNLAHAAIGKEGRNTLARVTIGADQTAWTSVRFGYSDRVLVYLNGKLLYKGDNTYVTRDYRYLGTIGQFDELPLELQEGDNELVFVVSETFGGWGVTAMFTETEGLRFEDGVVM